MKWDETGISTNPPKTIPTFKAGSKSVQSTAVRKVLTFMPALKPKADLPFPVCANVAEENKKIATTAASDFLISVHLVLVRTNVMIIGKYNDLKKEAKTGSFPGFLITNEDFCLPDKKIFISSET